MKLDTWIAVCANIGVIVGLVFLALEIRDAKVMAQAQMADAAVAGHNELNLALIADPQVARAFVVGIYEPDNLSDAEAVQFAAWKPDHCSRTKSPKKIAATRGKRIVVI